MAITQSALARAMAHDLVRTAPPEAGMKRIWVWSEHGYVDPKRDYVELTVFNDPVDDEAQHRLEEAVADLHNLYPEVNVLVYLHGPNAAARSQPAQWIRPDAEEMSLGAE